MQGAFGWLSERSPPAAIERALLAGERPLLLPPQLQVLQLQPPLPLPSFYEGGAVAPEVFGVLQPPTALRELQLEGDGSSSSRRVMVLLRPDDCLVSHSRGDVAGGGLLLAAGEAALCATAAFLGMLRLPHRVAHVAVALDDGHIGRRLRAGSSCPGGSCSDPGAAALEAMAAADRWGSPVASGSGSDSEGQGDESGSELSSDEGSHMEADAVQAPPEPPPEGQADESGSDLSSDEGSDMEAEAAQAPPQPPPPQPPQPPPRPVSHGGWLAALGGLGLRGLRLEGVVLEAADVEALRQHCSSLEVRGGGGFQSKTGIGRCAGGLPAPRVTAPRANDDRVCAARVGRGLQSAVHLVQQPARGWGGTSGTRTWGACIGCHPAVPHHTWPVGRPASLRNDTHLPACLVCCRSSAPSTARCRWRACRPWRRCRG